MRVNLTRFNPAGRRRGARPASSRGVLRRSDAWRLWPLRVGPNSEAAADEGRTKRRLMVVAPAGRSRPLTAFARRDHQRDLDPRPLPLTLLECGRCHQVVGSRSPVQRYCGECSAFLLDHLGGNARAFVPEVSSEDVVVARARVTGTSKGGLLGGSRLERGVPPRHPPCDARSRRPSRRGGHVSSPWPELRCPSDDG